jgi:hypothetical protein
MPVFVKSTVSLVPARLGLLEMLILPLTGAQTSEMSVSGTVSATIKLLDDRLVVRLMIILINQALDNVLFSSIKPLFDGINQAAW